VTIGALISKPTITTAVSVGMNARAMKAVSKVIALPPVLRARSVVTEPASILKQTRAIAVSVGMNAGMVKAVWTELVLLPAHKA